MQSECKLKSLILSKKLDTELSWTKLLVELESINIEDMGSIYPNLGDFLPYFNGLIGNKSFLPESSRDFILRFLSKNRSVLIEIKGARLKEMVLKPIPKKYFFEESNRATLKFEFQASQNDNRLSELSVCLNEAMYIDLETDQTELFK